ncbi:MAG: PqqD family protein [Acidimicrobiia bacterium]
MFALRENEGVTTDSTSGQVTPHPDVLTQKLPNGDAVLLHMGTEVYFGLDPVGAKMWEALTETGDIDTAGARLLEEFDVDEDRLLSDLIDLVAQLRDQGLLE